MPRASFGLPVYNGAPFLRETLESILAQTTTDFELIISDNASTDATPHILEEYAARDKRVKLIRQDHNVGAVANFRAVFEAATGEFFAWAGDHDVYHRTWLAECIYALEDRPHAVLTYPWTVMISRSGDVIKRNRSSEDTIGLDGYARVSVVAQMDSIGARIYGCFRRSAMREVRIHACAWWDRLFLTSMAVMGEFVQIERELWSRRETQERPSRVSQPKALMTRDALIRQFRTVHHEGHVPLYCRVPTLWHLACLVLDFALAPPYGTYDRTKAALGSYASWRHLRHMKYHLRIEAAVLMSIKINPHWRIK
jgi:glycosyltransferase involved in cell wall biosynthesis